MFRVIGSMEEINEEWKNFCNATSVHGIRSTFLTTKTQYKRRFWCVMFTLAVLGLIVCLGTILQKFCDPPINTKISLDQQAFNGIEFPAVTICNFNQVRRSYAEANPTVKWLMTQWWPSLRSIIYLDDDNMADDDLDDPPDLSDLDIQELLRNASQPLEEFLLTYGWEGTSRVEPLEQEMVQVMTDMGLCFTAKGHRTNSSRIARDTGISSGYYFWLNVNQSDYFVSPTFTAAAGIRILVHEYGEAPNVLTAGASIPVKSEAAVTITKRKNIYDSSVTGCLDIEADDFSNPLQYSHVYTTHACVAECQQRYINDICGCKTYTMPGDIPICNNQTSSRCYNQAKDEFRRSPSGRAACQCPRPCTEVLYDTSVTTATFPNSFYQDAIAKLAAKALPGDTKSTLELYQRAMQDLIVVYVYFEALSVEVMEQVPGYMFKDIWSDLGGILGLFFGASLFSVLEVLEFTSFAAFMKIRSFGRLTQVGAVPNSPPLEKKDNNHSKNYTDITWTTYPTTHYTNHYDINKILGSSDKVSPV